MPQPISLDLGHHDEPPLDLTIPLKREPPLLTLMAAAMVAVWQNEGEIDHDPR